MEVAPSDLESNSKSENVELDAAFNTGSDDAEDHIASSETESQPAVFQCSPQSNRPVIQNASSTRGSARREGILRRSYVKVAKKQEHS